MTIQIPSDDLPGIHQTVAHKEVFLHVTSSPNLQELTFNPIQARSNSSRLSLKEVGVGDQLKEDQQAIHDKPEQAHVAMGHNPWLHFGVDEHPF